MPMKIESWKGSDVSWLKSKDCFPGADNEILRNYRTPSGQSVFLYIGYFAAQTVDARLVSYRARPLFKGKEEVVITVGDSESLMVNFPQPEIGSARYKLLS